jgi:hypothetical protein
VLTALGVFALSAAALTTPLWLKNWIFHGDPLYPQLHAFFHPQPWVEGSDVVFEWGYKKFQMWQPPGGLRGFGRTLRMLYQFSFRPHDWPDFHGRLPVFGSLFTILCVGLPFVRAKGRVWGLAGLVHVGLVFWYWTHHQDRYLQAIVPLMIAVTAALMVLVWRMGRAPRAFLAAVVGLQVVWGADAAFIPARAGPQPLVDAIRILGQGSKGEYGERYELSGSVGAMQKVSKDLPEDAKLLMHEDLPRLGIARPTVMDHPGEQFLIDWARLGEPRRAQEMLRGLDVTHVYYGRKSKGWDTLAGDLTFFAFVEDFGKREFAAKGYAVVSLPREPIGEMRRSDRVGIITCDAETYPPGLYRLRDLTVPVFGPERLRFPAPTRADPKRIFELADYLVLDRRCHPRAPPKKLFRRVAKRARLNASSPETVGEELDDQEIYLRRLSPRPGKKM